MEHLSPEAIKAIAVCSVFIFAVLGAIILALLDHQRKMAEVMRADRKQADGLDERVDALQSDIRELKSLLTTSNPAPLPAEDLHRRLG